MFMETLPAHETAIVGIARARHPEVNNRPVLIHGQTLRKDQVQGLVDLKIFPSLFPMHTFYWGDWHRDSVLGPERAENISPTGWVLAAGLKFGTHHDAPLTLEEEEQRIAEDEAIIADEIEEDREILEQIEEDKHHD